MRLVLCIAPLHNTTNYKMYGLCAHVVALLTHSGSLSFSLKKKQKKGKRGGASSECPDDDELKLIPEDPQHPRSVIVQEAEVQAS